MAEIVLSQEVALDDPVLVEGLPGLGLVGKIATDHLVEELDMTYLGHVDCEGVPRVAMYDTESRVEAPVRLYADEERDFVALQSDVPVSRNATGFADCVTEWLAQRDALPLFLSGQATELDPEDVPETFGIGIGAGLDLLDEHDLGAPSERGAVGGPTGALLNRAHARDLPAVGLVVESDPKFPDPAAARQLIREGIEPIAGVSVSTDALVDRAEEIREQREELARRMGEADEEESSQATSMQGMFR